LAGELLIGEVARRTGRTVATLRHWEAIGLLAAPRRINGRRHYPPSVLDRIAVIELAQRAGLRLTEVAELLTAAPDKPPGPAWRTLAARKRAELDELAATIDAMRELLAHLAACGCDSVAGCAAVAQACRSERAVGGA